MPHSTGRPRHEQCTTVTPTVQYEDAGCRTRTLTRAPDRAASAQVTQAMPLFAEMVVEAVDGCKTSTHRPDSPLARFVHQLVETRSEEPTSRADSGETQLTAHTREEHSLARALAHVIACSLCTARTATRFGWGGRHRLHTHMLIERAASRRSTTRRRWMLSVAPIQIPSPQAIVCAAETVRTSSVPFLTSWLRRFTLQSSTRPKMRLSAESGNSIKSHTGGRLRPLARCAPSQRHLRPRHAAWWLYVLPHAVGLRGGPG